MLKNSITGWGLISQSFHWLAALLIFLSIIFGLIAENMDNSPLRLKLFILHKSFGISVLVIVVLRLLWRWIDVTPRAATKISANNQKLAKTGHTLLYVLVLAVSLSGWVLNSAANFPFRWFNWFGIPDLPWVSNHWKQAAIEIHWWLFLALSFLLIAHITMAFVHHYLHRSDLLLRMLPTRLITRFFSLFLFVLVFAVAFSFYWVQRSPIVANPDNSVRAGAENSVISQTLIEHTDHQWQVVEGRLGFVGRYGGEPFDGEFKSFSADLFFDPQAVETGFFRVTIDTSSITAYSEDFDSALVMPEWFDVQHYPQATYQAEDFQRTGEKITANGILTIKGLSAPVPLHFEWIESEPQRVDFKATATVDRRMFNIGVGEWGDDSTIGFDVEIQVNLNLDKVGNK